MEFRESKHTSRIPTRFLQGSKRFPDYARGWKPLHFVQSLNLTKPGAKPTQPIDICFQREGCDQILTATCVSSTYFVPSSRSPLSHCETGISQGKYLFSLTPKSDSGMCWGRCGHYRTLYLESPRSPKGTVAWKKRNTLYNSTSL